MAQNELPLELALPSALPLSPPKLAAFPCPLELDAPASRRELGASVSLRGLLAGLDSGLLSRLDAGASSPEFKSRAGVNLGPFFLRTSFTFLGVLLLTLFMVDSL